MADLTRSPFPGMDPWMELRWGDTHGKLTAYAADALNRVLPPDLYATTEERIVLDPLSRSVGRPDLFVVERPFAPAANGFDNGSESGGGVALAEPARIDVFMEPITEHFVEIRQGDGNLLVTTVEWISPTNKTDPEARTQFRDKRKAVLDGGASTIEIDLTRAGRRRGRDQLLRPLVLPDELRTDYLAVAKRANRVSRAEVYPLSLRHRLPAIGIPLRPGEGDAPLDLQALVDDVWRNGRYWNTNYDRPPAPPLPPEDAAWAAERVAAWRAG